MRNGVLILFKIAPPWVSVNSSRKSYHCVDTFWTSATVKPIIADQRGFHPTRREIIVRHRFEWLENLEGVSVHRGCPKRDHCFQGWTTRQPAFEFGDHHR